MVVFVVTVFYTVVVVMRPVVVLAIVLMAMSATVVRVVIMWGSEAVAGSAVTLQLPVIDVIVATLPVTVMRVVLVSLKYRYTFLMSPSMCRGGAREDCRSAHGKRECQGGNDLLAIHDVSPLFGPNWPLHCQDKKVLLNKG